MGRRRCQVIEKEVTLWEEEDAKESQVKKKEVALWEEEDAKESQVIEKEVTLLLQWRNPGPCFGAKVKFNS